MSTIIITLGGSETLWKGGNRAASTIIQQWHTPKKRGREEDYSFFGTTKINLKYSLFSMFSYTLRHPVNLTCSFSSSTIWDIKINISATKKQTKDKPFFPKDTVIFLLYTVGSGLKWDAGSRYVSKDRAKIPVTSNHDVDLGWDGIHDNTFVSVCTGIWLCTVKGLRKATYADLLACCPP